MSGKSKVKVVFLRALLVAMVLTALLILPRSMLLSSASPEDIGFVFVSVSPTRIQEGQSTNITLNLRDATANITQTFKINVTSPANVSYVFNLNISSNETGSGSNKTKFWSDFPSPADTNYVGVYRITVNDTLATSNFTVGLTDKPKYLRSETVSIRGSGYEPDETVLVDLKFGGASVSTFPINASSEGVVTSSWQVPADAVLGVYTLSISNTTTGGTVKTPVDVQIFTVEGICEIQTRNLANQTVAGVLVEVWNASSGLYLNMWNVTNETGRVQFILEAGNYTFKAFWGVPPRAKNVEVGVVNKNVTENVELSLKVKLSNLKLLVTDTTGAPIPLIDLSVMYNYTTRTNRTISETGSFTTNISGTVQLQNTFTNISYLITARRYDFLFNTTFIESLPGQAWSNITIIAPTYTLFVQVLDSKDAPAGGLSVKAYEWNSGIVGEPLQQGQTTSTGNVTFSLTIGRYRLRVYHDTTFLNEVTVDLDNQSSLIIHSNVYNVDLNVIVVDYFGQPISNVLIEFQRKVDSTYQTAESKTTGADGIARFNGIIGGDSLVYASVAGSPGETQNLYLTGPSETKVVFKMDGYVAIVGQALETAQFVTIILLLLLIVSFIIASTYKRLPRLFQRRRK